MIIDMHTHVGDFRSPTALERAPVTFEGLIARLDEEGIDKAVLLPLWPNPEGILFPYLFSPYPDVVSQIREAGRFSDRLILFGNVDPRAGGNSSRTDFSWVLEKFIEMGCVGIGEVTANLPADDPRVVNLFKQCGQWHLPVLIHVTGPGEGFYGLIDEVGSPRLERLLQQAPDTLIIGHGPGFWSEIGDGLTPESKSGYPQGPIANEGSVPRLLRTYPNLYADISAHSGYNALTRDEAFGIRFLNEFQDKLLFGTDVCFGDAQGRMPHLPYFRSLRSRDLLSQEAFAKITAENALRHVLRRMRSDADIDEMKGVAIR
jgi:predicted TIM-barrel fold metal-dependent hydrolase